MPICYGPLIYQLIYTSIYSPEVEVEVEVVGKEHLSATIPRKGVYWHLAWARQVNRVRGIQSTVIVRDQS